MQVLTLTGIPSINDCKKLGSRASQADSSCIFRSEIVFSGSLLSVLPEDIPTGSQLDLSQESSPAIEFSPNSLLGSPCTNLGSFWTCEQGHRPA